MKKIILMFIAVLGMALTSCTPLYSDPIRPQVIGTTTIHLNHDSGIYYVELDLMQYPIQTVAVFQEEKLEYVEPAENMEVTIFTAKNKNDIQAIQGLQDEEQIEEAFRKDMSYLHYITLGIVILFFVWMFIDGTRGKPL